MDKEKIQRRMDVALSGIDRDRMRQSDIAHAAEVAMWVAKEEVLAVLEEIRRANRSHGTEEKLDAIAARYK